MAVKNVDKTSKRIPLRGAIDGKPFTTENQPPPEAKSKGWQEKRAERLLTQMIIEKMTKGKALEEYVEALVTLATTEGNSKAIDTINKGIEDQIDKSEVKVETNIEKITFK